MKKQILVCSALFLGLSLAAQDGETSIEEVSIQGKFLNTPYRKVIENITVIGKKDLENAPAQSIEEALQHFTGVDIRRRGSNGVQSDISVRGGTTDQVLVLINGIRMNDSQTGHNTMNIPVDLQNVERIELIKGPAARRFGNQAYAVLNIITKTSAEEKMKFSQELGDHNTRQSGLATTFGTEKFSNLFQASYGTSDGYRYNTDYKISNFFYQNKFQLKNGHMGLQAGFSEKKFGANGFYASPKATEQYEEAQASVVSVMYGQQLGNWGISSSLYWRRGQDMYLYNRAKPEIYRNMHIGNNIGAELNASYKFSLGTTGVGADVRKEYLVSNNLGNRQRFINQMFFEHHFSLLEDKLQVTPGVTWAYFSNAGNFFYPGLDAGFSFNPNHKIYGNIAKVHRVPTYTDLYYSSKTELGNADLKPESAWSYEVGYRYLNNGFEAKASFFGRDTSDAIDWIKETEAELWKANNIGNIETLGFEVQVQQNFKGFLKSYSVGYTFLENKSIQNTVYSKYALDHMKHQLVAKIENAFLGMFSNQLVYRFQERGNGYHYHLLDEKLTYHQNDVELFLLINNLTNTNYTEAFSVPMPRRWFHLGFAYTLR